MRVMIVVPVLAVGVRRRAGPGARARPRAARARRRRPRRRAVRRPAARARHHDRRAERRGSPSNGSVAPIAAGQEPSPAARSRRCAAFEPDVVHLHEPLVARADARALLVGADVPPVGHLPRRRRRRRNGWYQTFRPAAAADGAPARRSAPRCRQDARRRSPRSVRRRVRDPAQRCRRRRASRRPSRGRRPRPPILFVGRHEPRKGLDVLLDAFAGLERDAMLWVAGDGPETERAARPRRRRASSGSGASPRTRRRARLRGATVVCFPALDGESFGIVLLEAMAAGAAVVASDIDGLPQRRPRRTGRRCSSRPATPTRCATRCAACSTTTACAGPSWSRAGEQRAAEFSMTPPRRAVHPASTSARSRPRRSTARDVPR